MESDQAPAPFTLPRVVQMETSPSQTVLFYDDEAATVLVLVDIGSGYLISKREAPQVEVLVGRAERRDEGIRLFMVSDVWLSLLPADATPEQIAGQLWTDLYALSQDPGLVERWRPDPALDLLPPAAAGGAGEQPQG